MRANLVGPIHDTRGRPSLYHPDYCADAVEYLSQGHSISALAGYLGVTRSTVIDWMGKHPEFGRAVQEGQAKAAQYWETVLRRVAETGNGNVAAAIFALKNRAAQDWADRVEHTGAGGGPIRTEDATGLELARRVAYMLAAAAGGGGVIEGEATEVPALAGGVSDSETEGQP